MVRRGRRFWGALVVLAVLVTSGGIGAAVASAATESPYVVTFVPGTDPDAVADALRAQGRDVRKVYRKVLAGVAVQLSSAAADSLRANPVVQQVEADRPVTLADTRSSATWGIDRIDQASLPLTTTYTYPTAAGVGTYIYVLDTGVRATHTELSGRVATGYSNVGDTIGTSDCYGHGTHVAATAAGRTVGVASRATVIPVRAFNCNAGSSESAVLDALEYVIKDTRRPAVLNLSIGGDVLPSIDQAVARVIDAGVTVVVAAGNDAIDACTRTPARVSRALTVAATDKADTRASYSNYGTCVDLFAPGDSVYSAAISSDSAYVTRSGTSMATPHVSGAVAVMLSRNPTMTPDQVHAAIVGAATPNKVVSPGTGTPNRLLYADTGAPPSNDAFASAAAPTLGTGGSVTGTTANATRETGEPLHAGITGSGSVWYRFTPTAAGTLTLSTEGSSIDTVLGVYSGTAVSALTTLGSNNDVAAGSTWSKVVVPVSANVTYRVAVAGASATGPVALRWTVSPALLITTSTLSAATVGSPYSATLAGTGGLGTYSWSLASGTLPAGLTLSSTGVISGTPTTAGTASITVAVTDGVSRVTKVLSLAVGTPSVVSPSFNLLLPASGATSVSRTAAVFTWSASAGATSYQFCLTPATAACGTTGSTGWVSVGTALTTTRGNLASKTVYYWQVRAVSSTNVITLGSGGVWRSFTTTT